MNLSKSKTGRFLSFLITFLYFSGYIVFSLMLAFNQPHTDSTSGFILSPPDEHVRILVPEYIAKHGTLPTGLEEEVRIESYGYSHALYNIFPYILQGGAMKLASMLGGNDYALFISARLVNVLLGAIMSFVVFLLGKRLFEKDSYRWAFCFLVTYLPQALFLHTYINTDSCSQLSTALIIYGLYLGYKDSFNFKNCTITGIGMSLCALSYYNAYGYILCAVILFFIYYIEKRNGKVTYNSKEAIKFGIYTACLCILLAGWAFIRSAIVLDGDFLGLRTARIMQETYGAAIIRHSNTYQGRGLTILTMIKEKGFFDTLFISSIGAFGSLSITGRGFIYHFYKLVIFSAIGCGIVNLFFKDKIPNKMGRFCVNMLVCAILPLAILIYYAYTVDYQAQGRYIMPALIPLAMFIVKGYERFLGHISRLFKRLPMAVISDIVMYLFTAGIIFCSIVMMYISLRFYNTLPSLFS